MLERFFWLCGGWIVEGESRGRKLVMIIVKFRGEMEIVWGKREEKIDGVERVEFGDGDRVESIEGLWIFR